MKLIPKFVFQLIIKFELGNQLIPIYILTIYYVTVIKDFEMFTNYVNNKNITCVLCKYTCLCIMLWCLIVTGTYYCIRVNMILK